MVQNMTGKVALLLAIMGLGLAAPSCTTEEGQTPECEADIGPNGENQHKSNGCNPFAICTNAAGEQADPMECCKDVDPGDLEACLYGYGVVTNPTGGGGSGGSGATTTTTGAGGGGGN